MSTKIMDQITKFPGRVLSDFLHEDDQFFFGFWWPVDTRRKIQVTQIFNAYLEYSKICDERLLLIACDERTPGILGHSLTDQKLITDFTVHIDFF